jgi:hypothetical protein
MSWSTGATTVPLRARLRCDESLMTLKSLHKLKPFHFSQSAFKRSTIIEEHRNWSCVARQKLIFRESSWIFFGVTSPCVPSIDCFDSIVFEPTNSDTRVLRTLIIVNLTFRSSLTWLLEVLSLDGFSCSSTCRREKDPTQVRCMSTKSPVKIEWEEDINNNTAKESWYTYSSLWVVEGIVLTRILDHLMLQIAIADGWMNW